MRQKALPLPNTYPMRDARNRFTEIARAVQEGTRVTVTVHGRPIVDIVPHDPQAAAAAIERPPRKLPAQRVSLQGITLDELLEDQRGDR